MASLGGITAAIGPMVGRRRELAQLAELLERERLVTMTGAGGSGKTRLALELVAHAGDEALFVQLAPLRDPSLVAGAIAQAAGLDGADAEKALMEGFASRRLLVCLDNFEHVVEAGGLVSRLLRMAPEVRFLVTSRTPLGLSDEQEFPLAPLDASEALEFFIARARRFQPEFEPDDAVGEICRRLDGLPLALELAAARVKMMTPAQMLDRLEHRLPLLAAGSRDVPERHRTLRAAIDWSYRLLSPDEQQLFARLSLFPGGCTLEAAVAVDAEDADTLELVASLIDKSLLRRQQGEAEPRFRMLETLREYAHERLMESDAAHEVEARQLAYYVELAERSQAEMMQSGKYAQWVKVLRDELDNLEAIVYGNLESDPESALRILAACGSRAFHLAPARVSTWLDEALAVISSVPPNVAAAVLRSAGFVHLVARDLERAEELLLAAVDAHARIGDQGQAARARGLLSTVYAYMGRGDDAHEAARRAIDDARAAGEDDLVMVLPNVAGSMSLLEDFPRARAALEEAIVLAEHRGALGSLWVSRINLGNVLLHENPARAAEVFRAAVADAESVPDTQVLHAREGIAMATLLTGDPEGARREFGAYIDMARETGRHAQVHAAVGGLMAVASASGDAASAARLAGARRELAPAISLPSYLRPYADAARTALGADEWQRLEAEGGALPLDDVLRPVLARAEAAGAASRAFLFTDIVSSTQLLQAIGDLAWGNLVSWHDRTLRSLFAAHSGEEVDHAGDGFFVAFGAATEAIACAGAIQRALAEHRRTHGFAPEVRIGVHEAEASPAEGGWRGLGVHTAARIAGTAEAGEVVASLATAKSAGAAVSGDPVETTLKGLAAPIDVVRIDWSRTPE